MSDKIKPLKYLGQNFLCSPQIAKKIVKLLGNIEGKNIYEIGPGMGALTTHIINEGANLTCFDIDLRSIDYLKQKFYNIPNIQIIHSDIRNINLSEENKNISVIGNIPYNITGDILYWLINNSDNIDCAVLTIQKEVAKRWIAKENTKEYGISTLALKLYGNTKICFNISPNSFHPKPKVTSSVVLIKFDKELYKDINKEALLKFIKSAFNMRRKVLSNSLNNYFNLHNVDKNQLAIHLSNHNKNYLKMRAEQLTLQDYIFFFDIVSKLF
ncbi:MAG: 16S rRNA (adenine(1518)-N(6)/adenine(1519)-N(6))-dimethyltransferase RsmA [Bacteroidetes bacterium]|nr:16S rRNA (adenine(1518)-N(6)/adenine(1519)-N(6))-dimethyltransferase RsmA [Bacteroidota bacterium]